MVNYVLYMCAMKAYVLSSCDLKLFDNDAITLLHAELY